MKIADHDYFVYDFALPMVVLYSLYSGKSNRLANWLQMSPMKQFTTAIRMTESVSWMLETY